MALAPTARQLLAVSIAQTLGAFALLIVGLRSGDAQVLQAQFALAVHGGIMTGLYGFIHGHLPRFAGKPLGPTASLVALIQSVGALALATAAFVPAAGWTRVIAAALLLAAGVLHMIAVLKALPRKGDSVVTDADPLTKGDDACMAQLRFAHRFLSLGILVLFAAAVTAALADASVWSGRLTVAGHHLLLVGFGLFGWYAVSHLLVPRYSGVPAIAAGAIKGELHSGLLGLTGIVVAFLIGIETGLGRGLLVGLGPFLFLSFFTFMGVLGANIMKNKSKTQRVTREFVYVPWTFTAVFWLVCAVLLGIFLGFAPAALPEKAAGLRSVHFNMALAGGFLQLAMAFATRWVPEEGGSQVPLFQSMRLAYFLFNGGLAASLAGMLGAGANWSLGGAVATAVGLLLYLLALKPSWTAARMPSA